MNMTLHAETRMSQRGIPQGAVDLVLAFGDAEHHKGREIFRLTRKGEKRLKRYYGKVAQALIEMVRPCYVVVDGNDVITVARRNRNFKRNR